MKQYIAETLLSAEALEKWLNEHPGYKLAALVPVEETQSTQGHVMAVMERRA